MDQIFSEERTTGSLGRSDILRCRAVGISEPIESLIAIKAAERSRGYTRYPRSSYCRVRFGL